MVTEPPSVEPLAGETKPTVGAVVSLNTETVTDADARLPAASRAVAAIVCGPLGAVFVSHGSVNEGPVSSGPNGVPSMLNWTPVTPTLSVALAPITTAPAIGCAPAGETIEIDGAVVSLNTVTMTEAVVELPAPSRATALRVCGPLEAVFVSHETV